MRWKASRDRRLKSVANKITGSGTGLSGWWWVRKSNGTGERSSSDSAKLPCSQREGPRRPCDETAMSGECRRLASWSRRATASWREWDSAITISGGRTAG